MNKLICKSCSKGTLTLFDVGDNLKTYTCNKCSTITQFVKEGDNWQMFVGGVAFAVNAIVIMQYLGFEHFGDLTDWFSDNVL